MGSKIKNTKSNSNNIKTTFTLSSEKAKIARNGEGKSMVAPHPPKKK